MNKPIVTPEILTLEANAWCDNVRQWSDDIDQLQSDHAEFRRRVDAAIVNLREAGAAEKAPGQQ